MATIGSGDSGSAYSYRQPDLTYRLGAETVAGKIDGIEAVRQAVRHILMTERYSKAIYDDDYGVELEQYIGADFGVVLAGIEGTLREALCQDDRITDVQVNDVSKSTEQASACVVQFSVLTIYGSIEETLNVAR